MSSPHPAGRAPRRRLLPLWLVVVAFVIVPLAEIYVLIQVGQVIGPWWTILLLVLDSLIGGWLVKREGGRAWTALRTALASGRMPARELADGGLILIGGTLMLTPGFVSDIFGFFFILPFTRPIARRALTRVLARRLVPVDPTHLGAGGPFGPRAGGPFGPGADGPFGPGRGPNATRPRPDASAGGTVVEGEVIDP